MDLADQLYQHTVYGARTETSLNQSFPEGQQALLHEPQLLKENFNLIMAEERKICKCANGEYVSDLQKQVTGDNPR